MLLTSRTGIDGGGLVDPSDQTERSSDAADASGSIGDSTPARAPIADAPSTQQQMEEAAGLLFRSVRAGRAWVRARGLAETATDVNAGASIAASACVLIKPGNDEPPVFFIPGAPGSVLQLAPLATALPVQMPAYAIKPRGLDEGEIPFQRIEDMAAYSIGMIRHVRPKGPYSLVGYSTGGIVALEIARQLAAAGEEISILVLLDSYPSRRIWPLRCHAEILARQTVRALCALVRRAPSQGLREAAGRGRSLSHYLAMSGLEFLPRAAIVPKGASPASRRVHVASVSAGEAYRPARYLGKVVFVQPREVPNLEPRAPAQVWRRFLPDFEVRRVPGSHRTMVEPEFAAATARVIGECLTRSVPTRPGQA